LNLKYSKSPHKLATTTDKNQRIDRVIAKSEGTPIVPKKMTNAPSLKPIPDMDTGMKEIRIIIGTKIRRDRNEIFREIPFDKI
jgi:hypothetical protein